MHWKGKAYYFIIGFLFLIIHPVSGQDQKVADSLKRIYKQENSARFHETGITQKLMLLMR